MMIGEIELCDTAQPQGPGLLLILEIHTVSTL